MTLLLNIRALILLGWLTAAGAIAFIPAAVTAGNDNAQLALRAREILKQRCYQCHGANGAAKKGVFVLDRDRLISSRVLIPGDVNSPLLKLSESGAMPVGGPQLSAGEKGALRDWITQGAPDWQSDPALPARAFLSEASILAIIREDLLTSDERARPFLRYFSLAHLLNAGVPDQELELYRAALAKLVNSLSWHREITAPTPVDRSKTVLRIDLRDYNWTASTWSAIAAHYPYGVRSQESQIIAQLSGASLPYLRADWFAAKASAPPLYHAILNLPGTARELERQLGVDVSRNLQEEKNIARAGLRASGVSQNNRVLERHASPYGAYWKSYDFRSNSGDQNIFNDPLRLNPAGGEMIFSLPNGLQGYLLTDAHGNRIDRAPIDIVADRNNPDEPVIENGRSCMSCHYEGMQTFKDDMRAVIRNISTARFDRDKALAIYIEQGSLDRLIEKDRERFEAALRQTGGASGNAMTEPINALARRHDSDLTVAGAAAEVGMQPGEFQERLRASAHLISLGFGQLLATSGGIKRDSWEKSFGEVARELRIGNHAPVENLSFAQRPVRGINREVSRADILSADPADILKSARTLHVWSGTVYLNSDRFEDELRKRPEFRALGLIIVKDQRLADLTIKLGRPLFTFNFTYNVTHTKSSMMVTSGKVTAFDGGSAAPKIAKEFLKQVRAAREPATPLKN
ncbi:MAG TPA: hypothetical protein VIG62_06350 [Blastocatellia bacterium]